MSARLDPKSWPDRYWWAYGQVRQLTARERWAVLDRHDRTCLYCLFANNCQLRLALDHAAELPAPGCDHCGEPSGVGPAVTPWRSLLLCRRYRSRFLDVLQARGLTTIDPADELDPWGDP